jgi:predicted outer membrane repeat protein
MKKSVVIFWLAVFGFTASIGFAQSFPDGFRGTWKRPQYASTLSFTVNTVKASNRDVVWTLRSVSGNRCTIVSSGTGTVLALTIRLVDGKLEISGDSGKGEGNWNGSYASVKPPGPDAVLYEGASDTPVSGVSSLAEALAWITANADTDIEYIIELKANDAIAPALLSYGGKKVTLILKGDETMRIVSLSGNGSLFTVGSGITLTLDNNVTLQGKSDNTASLVRVNPTGALGMKGNAAITGNKSSSDSGGGGVFVNGGNFTMSDSATVSDNTVVSTREGNGGGVYVKDGSFTMSDNVTVSGNTTSSYGGGLYFSNGSFAMSGNATVSGNKASYKGAGVYISGGNATFTMSGSASVSGNTISSSYSGDGGGVYLDSDGSFTMSGNASVSDNTTTVNGGGVYISGFSVTFTMEDKATVSGNKASHYAGGVSFDSNGSFTMSGSASVSGNTTSGYGGGVYISSRGSFTMSGSAAVSGNTVTSTYSSSGDGGGVLSSGSFTMKDNATIFGNTSSGSGGGVHGSVTMSGSASVSGNTASASGGGVHGGYGSIIMSDSATFSGNTSSGNGGGVYFSGNGSFTMRGNATVSSNTTSGSGGGVYSSSSTIGSFAMSDSVAIFGNTASKSGGGVYVDYNFAKTGGIIYGSYESNPTLRNVVTGQTDKGAAVYADDTHHRETTVGAGQNLSKHWSERNYIGAWSD